MSRRKVFGFNADWRSFFHLCVGWKCLIRPVLLSYFHRHLGCIKVKGKLLRSLCRVADVNGVALGIIGTDGEPMSVSVIVFFCSLSDSPCIYDLAYRKVFGVNADLRSFFYLCTARKCLPRLIFFTLVHRHLWPVKVKGKLLSGLCRITDGNNTAFGILGRYGILTVIWISWNIPFPDFPCIYYFSCGKILSYDVQFHPNRQLIAVSNVTVFIIVNYPHLYLCLIKGNYHLVTFDSISKRYTITAVGINFAYGMDKLRPLCRNDCISYFPCLYGSVGRKPYRSQPQPCMFLNCRTARESIPCSCLLRFNL